MKSIIHVNRNLIVKNNKDGKNRPLYTIKQGSTIRYAREVEILGRCKLVQGSLSCGAKAWIETDSELKLYEETTFAEIEKDYK